MIGFGLMLTVAGIIVLIAGIAQAVQNRFYATGSEIVTGTVIRKQSRHVKNGKAYELTISYMVDEVVYEKVVGVLLTEFQTIHEGDKFELRYKMANPKKAVCPMVLKPRNVRRVLFVGVVLIAVGIVLFFIGMM